MASVGDYESALDASAASWVVAGLRGFAESVLSLVPAGFPAYGRIFHPAGNGQLETPITAGIAVVSPPRTAACRPVKVLSIPCSCDRLRW